MSKENIVSNRESITIPSHGIIKEYVDKETYEETVHEFEAGVEANRKAISALNSDYVSLRVRCIDSFDAHQKAIDELMYKNKIARVSIAFLSIVVGIMAVYLLVK